MSVEHWWIESDWGKPNCWYRNATPAQSVLANSNLQLTSTAFTQRNALLGSNALLCSEVVHSQHFVSSVTGVRCSMRVQKVTFCVRHHFLFARLSALLTKVTELLVCFVQFKTQGVRHSSDSAVYISCH